MMILVVLVQTTLFAQSKQTTEKPLKLSSVAFGTLSDNVLLRGVNDKVVKRISVDSLLAGRATVSFVMSEDSFKASINSPTFTGSPKAPTQTAGNNTTAIATTAFVTTADNLKANLASPTFTGTPTLPTGTIATTQTAGNNTTAIATTAFVAGEIGAGNTDSVTKSTVQTITANKTFSGSTAFNGTTIFGQLIRFSNQTLLASNTVYTSGALGTVDGHFSFASDNKFPASFSTELVTISIKPILKVPNKSGILATTDDFLNYAPLASPTFTGTPTLPTGTIATTQAAGNNTTAIATTAFVTTAGNLKANLVSPIFTGTPTLPTGTIATTQTAGNNSTAIATTAFVLTNAIATTGNQTKSGQFTINNTLGATEGLVVNNSSSGITNGIFSYNSNTGRGINASNASTGDALFVNNINAGRGIVLINQSTGLGSLFQNTSSGTALYFDISSTGKAVLINNSTAATGIPFTIQKNSTDKLTINDAGQVTGAAYNISALNTAPATATATGTLGEIRFTPTGIFICTATNTWIKCVGATF